jgi:hypothetical protein
VSEWLTSRLVPGDDELTELELADESGSKAGDDKPKQPKEDDFWALAPREPIRAPARRSSGRSRLLMVMGGVALLAFAIGLVTPTPESVELSGSDSDDGADADIPRLEVPVGWSVTPLVVENPGAVPQDELLPLVNELLTATADATSSSGLPASPQLAVCDPARHPGLLSGNNELTQQDLDKLSAALC